MAIRWVLSVIDTAPPDVRPEVLQAIRGAYSPNSNFSRGLHPTLGAKIRDRDGSRAVRTSDQVA
jgi:hypothetical protein